jgi:hypothetical protein
MTPILRDDVVWVTRPPHRFARLICRAVAHQWTVESLTGRYVWCQRCAARFELKEASQ